MTFKEIQELIALVNKSNLTEFIMQDGDQKIVIRTSKYIKGRPFAASEQAPPPVYQQPAPPPALRLSEPAQQDLAPPPPKAPAVDPSAGLLEIRSPIVGTFYRSATPEKGPFIKIGDAVIKGTVVCLIEAMKLFNEIESEVKGKIVKIVADDASPVEYDQVLFLVDPN